MSETTNQLRDSLENLLDVLEMAGFNDGFEACLNAIDELSNQMHNDNNTAGAEALRWAVKELSGNNDETD